MKETKYPEKVTDKIDLSHNVVLSTLFYGKILLKVAISTITLTHPTSIK
jgi:hypothetical protein